MMIVEDNSFDFVVRDHLRKKFDEKVLPSSWQRSKDHLMLDMIMITYCSRGNKEDAANNLTATLGIMAGLSVSAGGWLGMVGDCWDTCGPT